MSGLYLPGEVVPSVPPSRAWSTTGAKGWLYGWARSDHLGYRQVRVGGNVAVVASTTGKRWDQYIADLSTALTAAAGWTATIGTDGRVTLAGASGILSYPDRLGWLLGMGAEAGTIEAAAVASRVSRFVPPGGIPLLGLTWTEVNVEREKELVTDRTRRQGGYAFGGARIWRWQLKMSRWAYEALCVGWCLRGKITLAGSSTTAISSAVPGGALTGYVLGLVGSPTWDGPTQEVCTATLIVAGDTT